MKRLLLVAFALLAAGCETLAPRVEGPADPQAWQERRAWLESIDDWRLEGRVAIAAYDEGWNASVDWEQRGDYLDVNFSGPLGVGSARVAGTPELLEVHSTEGEHFVTSDPEQDLYWHLGWTAPIDRMAWWVRGLPGPGGEPRVEIDAAGRPVRIEQGGWIVDYVDYLLLDDGRALPRRIEMRREGVRIRLIVSEWDLEPRP